MADIPALIVNVFKEFSKLIRALLLRSLCVSK